MKDQELEKDFLYEPAASGAEKFQNIVESKYCPDDLQKTVSKCNSLNTIETEYINCYPRFKSSLMVNLVKWREVPV
jgi:hypothetical protein